MRAIPHPTEATMPDPKPWHEQDEFWERVWPVLFDAQRLADAPADVDNIIALG